MPGETNTRSQTDTETCPCRLPDITPTPKPAGVAEKPTPHPAPRTAAGSPARTPPWRGGRPLPRLRRGTQPGWDGVGGTGGAPNQEESPHPELLPTAASVHPDLGRLRAPAAPEPGVMPSGDSAGRGTVPTQKSQHNSFHYSREWPRNSPLLIWSRPCEGERGEEAASTVLLGGRPGCPRACPRPVRQPAPHQCQMPVTLCSGRDQLLCQGKLCRSAGRGQSLGRGCPTQRALRCSQTASG